MAPALNAPLILRGTLVRGEGPIWRQDQQSVVLPEAVTRTALSPPGHWPSLQGAVHSAQPGGPGSRVRPATVPLSRWGSVAVRNQEDVEASWLGAPGESRHLFSPPNCLPPSPLAMGLVVCFLLRLQPILHTAAVDLEQKSQALSAPIDPSRTSVT